MALRKLVFAVPQLVYCRWPRVPRQMASTMQPPDELEALIDLLVETESEISNAPDPEPACEGIIRQGQVLCVRY